jgi:hypothetical protein
VEGEPLAESGVSVADIGPRPPPPGLGNVT